MRIQVYIILSLFVLSSTVFSQTAIDFTFTDTQGQEHTLYEDYLDEGKTVLIDFFFVDCPPCNTFAPHLKEIYDDWGSGQEDVEFFTLSSKGWDSNADVEGYEQQHGHTNPGAGEDGGALDIYFTYHNSEFGPISGSPHFIVIAPNGTVFKDVDGPGTQGRKDAINSAITEAVELTDFIDEPIIDTFIININLKDTKDEVVNNISYTLMSSDGTGPSYPITLDPNGQLVIIDFEATFPGLTDPIITPSKEGDFLNGVFTTDIIFILRHLLGIQPFTYDYQYIAADVSNDGNVTSADMSEIRKTILEQQDGFSSGLSWTFDPISISIDQMTPGTYNFDIEGIKMGDVNRH